MRRLIDHALEAERDGIWGRGYVDMGGPFPMGDAWLGRAADLIEAAGFPVVRDTRGGVFEPFERFDRPILYLGWYRQDVDGVFLRPGFHFPPGAIALHIHSYSAAPLRSRDKAWVGPLVARGVAATFGNVNEPYLQFTHRPDVLVERLLAGDTVGEAALHSLPALSWQAVMVGDPLFRPFPGGAAALLERARASSDPYAAVVAARLLVRVDRAGAMRLLKEKWLIARHPIIAMSMLESADPSERAEAASLLCASDWTATSEEPAILNDAITLLRQSGQDASAQAMMRLRGDQNHPHAAR